MEPPMSPIGETQDEVQDPVFPEGLELCEGIGRSKWATLPVTLLGTDGMPVAKAVCHCIDPRLVLGIDGPLGDHQVAVQINSSLNEDVIPSSWEWSMRGWLITRTMHGGYSLANHEKRNIYDEAVLAKQRPPRTGLRAYSSIVRSKAAVISSSREKKLSMESINLVASRTCCKDSCVQHYPRRLICLLRQTMYGSSEWKFRNHMKLNVHRQVHKDAAGKRVITLEGVDVCEVAWMHIMGVPKSTFYKKRLESETGRRNTRHGNFGIQKPREHIVQASATLRRLLVGSADQMPHKSHTLRNGERTIAMSLPSSFTWKAMLPQLNDANCSLGLPPVSQSSLSKIRKEQFPEYNRILPGDSFARCSTCDRLKAQRDATTPGSRAYELHVLNINAHNAVQRVHREHYYANRQYSEQNPREVLSIIHDKMDHAKTALPAFSHKTKLNDALMKLPIAVSGVFAHGHGNGRYAHFGLDFFPHDSNHTVGSICKVLRDLEGPKASDTGQLFVGSGSTPLYRALLSGKEKCEVSLPPASEVCEETFDLPPILHVQLDNACSDNKNRYMNCFWSLLVAREVFKEVYVNFLIVGHTHDDIDAMFGRWSMELRKENNPTLPDLMKSLMIMDECMTVIPHLIEEVPDFKGFIEGFISERDVVSNKDASLTGHLKAQCFKFYMHSNGWPVMQYKLFCTDSE